MKKLVVLSMITLDGVMQAPGAPAEDLSGGFPYGGWMAPYADEVLGAVIAEQMRMPANLLLGRKTFEIWAAYWPYHEEGWPGINTRTKYVASNTLTTPDWENSVVLQGNVAEAVRKLKQQDGPDLHVYGSANLIQTLMRHDLVDELWLKIYPLTLGTGKRLFPEGTIPAAFTVSESKVSSKGVIAANYHRAGEVQMGTVGS